MVDLSGLMTVLAVWTYLALFFKWPDQVSGFTAVTLLLIGAFWISLELYWMSS